MLSIAKFSAFRHHGVVFSSIFSLSVSSSARCFMLAYDGIRVGALMGQ
jgi:hypothetical protein